MIFRSYSDYAMEHASIGMPASQLQIVSTCNANCIFCSNKQNPFKIKRLAPRKVEEIEKYIWSISPSYDGLISINESLPGRISEGEALIHPDLICILNKIRKNSPLAKIGITTNGSLLSNKMLNDLNNVGNVELNISIHSLDKEEWCKIFNLKEDGYYNAISSFEKAKMLNIPTEASIVALPNLVGYKGIDHLIGFLKKYTEYIRIWSPGYTKHTNKDIVENLSFEYNEMKAFIDSQRKKHKIILDWSLDEDSIKLPENLLIDIILENKKDNHIPVLLTSVATFSKLSYFIEKMNKIYSSNCEVIKVKNTTYGGNIICSGLWMVKDIEEAIEEYILSNNCKEKVLYFPTNFLDMFGNDLMLDNISRVINKFNQVRIEGIR